MRFEIGYIECRFQISNLKSEICTVLLSSQHKQIEHRTCELLFGGVGKLLRQHLIELSLKHFFSATAVKISRLIHRLSHLGNQLPKERIANEVPEGILQLLRLRGRTGRKRIRRRFER